MMTGAGWSLVEVASQLLERDEREAALGDLLEGGKSASQGLLDVLGLVSRRQTVPWKSWRPWLAAFGLALPSSFLLMGFSLSVSWTYQHFIDPKVTQANGLPVGSGLWLLLCNVFLLAGWSWTSGFVVGSLSRRTLWASIAACCFPCLFCLARFRVESMSRFCLLLFLLPAIWGVLQGLRLTRIKLGSAIVLAVAVTVLMISACSSQGLWTLNWALIWPAWYLVATAGKPMSEARTIEVADGKGGSKAR
jgi:hypothetical protein